MLKFPLEYDAKMPFAHFFGKQYQYAKGDVKASKMAYKASGETVSLYMPGSFNESVTNTWGRTTLIGGGEGTFGGAVSNEITQQLAKVAGAKVTSTAQALKGFAVQPTDMLIFTGIDAPILTFKFQLIPLNDKESAAIKNIVATFKKSMLPSGSTESSIAILSYPKVWDIHFTGVKGLGIEFQDVYMDMALKSCVIDYSHGESFMVFHDEMPVQMSLNLTFEGIRRPMQNQI